MNNAAKLKRISVVQAGTIKLLSLRGYGFIKTASGADVFFSHSVVDERQFDELTAGQAVEFVLAASAERGPRATFVRPLCVRRLAA